jgi:hypothetical protein
MTGDYGALKLPGKVWGENCVHRAYEQASRDSVVAEGLVDGRSSTWAHRDTQIVHCATPAVGSGSVVSGGRVKLNGPCGCLDFRCMLRSASANRQDRVRGRELKSMQSGGTKWV